MKSLSLALALVCLVGLSGCKTIEQELQDNLGLKTMEFQGNAQRDTCVSWQFTELYNEYMALTNNERAAIKAIVSSKLDTLIFQESTVTGEVSGATSTLLLLETVCNGSTCTVVEKGRKQVSDLTATTGNTPAATQTARDGRVLKLIPQMKLNNITRHMYSTTLLPTYDHTDSDEALLAGLRSGEVSFLRDDPQSLPNCGMLVTLKSLADSLE